MRKYILVLVSMVGTMGMAFGVANGTVDEPPKHKIKDVMKVHKKLLTKVSKGKASDKEQLELLDLYVSLNENKAPKGDQAAWTARTNAMVVATAKVITGRKGAEAALGKAANCGACHKNHKP